MQITQLIGRTTEVGEWRANPPKAALFGAHVMKFILR